jgi:competence ComEA-like helix-hairpin-helix protein
MKSPLKPNLSSGVRVNISKLPMPLSIIIAIIVVGMAVYAFVTYYLSEQEPPATPGDPTTQTTPATTPGGSTDSAATPATATAGDPAAPTDPATATHAPPADPAPTFPININTADVKALILLPNIGEARANKIIAYRTANGPFATIEDIQNVKGIGPEIFKELRDKVTV